MLRRAAISALRIQRQTATATELVRFLNKNYPDLKVRSTALDPDAPSASHSATFAADLGTQERAFKFINELARLGIKIVNNFGSKETSSNHPGTTTQSSLTDDEQAEQEIGPGFVRFSVGLEGPFLKRAFVHVLRKRQITLG
jgi:O-succinylhomoserine sulfhydrylase